KVVKVPGPGDYCGCAVELTGACAPSCDPTAGLCTIQLGAGSFATGLCLPTTAAGDYKCLGRDSADIRGCSSRISCSTDECCQDDPSEDCQIGGIGCEGICVVGDGPACKAFEKVELCNNGTLDPGETCDSDQVRGVTCASLGLPGDQP